MRLQAGSLISSGSALTPQTASTVGLLSAVQITDFAHCPVDWATAVRETLDVHGQDIVLPGGSTTSLDPPGRRSTHVRCVFGDVLDAEAPWLWDLYTDDLLGYVASAFGVAVSVASNRRTGVLLQEVRDTQSGYELHVDSNPLTALLFADSLKPEDGGLLQFFTASGRYQILPAAGWVLLYDARRVPHRVTPLSCLHVRRRTVVMNFYHPAVPERRPADLDDYVLGLQE